MKRFYSKNVLLNFGAMNVKKSFGIDSSYVCILKLMFQEKPSARPGKHDLCVLLVNDHR